MKFQTESQWFRRNKSILFKIEPEAGWMTLKKFYSITVELHIFTTSAGCTIKLVEAATILYTARVGR